jgi:hypothetical protein
MQTAIVLSELVQSPLKVFTHCVLQEHDTSTIPEKVKALQSVIQGIEGLESSAENQANLFTWTGIASGFSTMLCLSALTTINPLIGAIVSTLSAASTAGTIGISFTQNQQRKSALEELKRYKLVIRSDQLLNWAVLWQFADDDLFLDALYEASTGKIFTDSMQPKLVKSTGKNPMAAALDLVADYHGLTRDALIAVLGQVKQGVAVSLPPKPTAMLPSVQDTALGVIESAPTKLQPPINNSPQQAPAEAQVFQKLASLPLDQRAETVVNVLIEGGFKIDECLGSQIVVICGTQRGGKGTLAAILATLSKALDSNLDTQYFTAGVDVYPFACNLTSALSFPNRDSDAADKSVADELLLFLRKLDGAEPYTNQNLLLVIDEATRLLSLLEEGDRTWAIQYGSNRFAKCGGTLILVLHASNLTSVAGKSTAGLASTFKQSVSFIGCVAKSVKVSGLRKMNIASGAYFKADPDNFGEPIADGELGTIPEWLKTDLHPGNGHPDPARSLLGLFPELVQQHKAAPNSVISQLENSFLATPVEDIDPEETIKDEDLNLIVLIVASATSGTVSFEAIRTSRKWEKRPGSPYLRKALDALVAAEKLTGSEKDGYAMVASEPP